MTSSRTVVAVAGAAVAVLLAGCGSSGTPAATSTGTSASSAAAGSSGVTSSAASGSAASGSALTTPSGSSAPGSSGAAPADAAMEQYCQQSGGQVQSRNPYWNTNGDQSQWLALAGSATMCRFQADDEATSRIYVDLDTLSSSLPTLAGLAYLSQLPMPSVTGGANPATLYCKNLGGSSTFGSAGAAGGGWVAKDDPDDVVVWLCVFPDLSFIDEWGLAYHSDGTIRGTDLATAMAYQAESLPPVFPTTDTRATPTS